MCVMQNLLIQGISIKLKWYQQFTLLVMSNASSLPADSKCCSVSVHDFRPLTAEEENRGRTSACDSAENSE